MRRMPTGRRSGVPAAPERGSASMVTVTLAGLLVFVGGALAGASALVVDHRRAQAAADLAALAGAAAPADPCGAAARIAEANGARLVGCAPRGADLVVSVTVTSGAWPGRDLVVTAQARAGPT